MDDNAGIRQALKILLPVHFAEVEALPSPVTLVSTLERFRPDVVLLDMNFNTSINTVHIALPALRERKEDIVPLAQLFLERFAEKYHRLLTGIAPDAAVMLTEGRWSGNIRELQNCIEKAVILSEAKNLTAREQRYALKVLLQAGDLNKTQIAARLTVRKNSREFLQLSLKNNILIS